MKYKAIDLFTLKKPLTKRQFFDLALAHQCPDGLQKEAFMRTFERDDRYVIEMTAYETQNQDTQFEYTDIWVFNIALNHNNILFETVYPPSFDFESMDHDALTQDRHAYNNIIAFLNRLNDNDYIENTKILKYKTKHASPA